MLGQASFWVWGKEKWIRPTAAFEKITVQWGGGGNRQVNDFPVKHVMLQVPTMIWDNLCFKIKITLQ